MRGNVPKPRAPLRATTRCVAGEARRPHPTRSRTRAQRRRRKKVRPRAPALLNRRARHAVQELAAQPTKHNLGGSTSTSRPAYFAPVLPESGRSTQQPMPLCRQPYLPSPMARMQLTVYCQQVSILGAGCCYRSTDHAALLSAKRLCDASREGVTAGHQGNGSFCSFSSSDNQGFFGRIIGVSLINCLQAFMRSTTSIIALLKDCAARLFLLQSQVSLSSTEKVISSSFAFALGSASQACINPNQNCAQARLPANARLSWA